MPYLIDGHNLIGKLPDIDLAEENDENKLVVKLKGFAAYSGKKITVVFDKGMPAGVDRIKSNNSVSVVYANAYKSNADRVLIERIRNIKDGKNWIVVSSDNEVRGIAVSHHMRVMRSSEFAAELSKMGKRQQIDRSEAINPLLSPDELAEWEKIFSEKTSSDLNKRRK